jgi:hypothetical protein
LLESIGARAYGDATTAQLRRAPNHDGAASYDGKQPDVDEDDRDEQFDEGEPGTTSSGAPRRE